MEVNVVLVGTNENGSAPGPGNNKDHKSSENVAETKGTFTFLYDQSLGAPIVDVVSGDLKVTKISLDNKYYIKEGYPVSNRPNEKGKSTAVVRRSNGEDYNYSRWIRSHSASSFKSQPASKLPLYSVLNNCVGYANGRLIEIWDRALEIGYLVKKDGKYYLKNGTEVPDLKWNQLKNLIVNSPPDWYNSWPTSWAGFSKGNTPQVGAVAIWGHKTNGYFDGAGHVAIVEEIIDAGGANERIVVSESSSGCDGVEKVAWVNLSKKSYSIKKSSGYNYNQYLGSSYQFMGFLISPVCQLSSTNALISQSTSSVNLNKIVITEEQAEEIKQKREENYRLLQGIKTEKVYKVNDRVQIVWLGNTQPDGKGSRVNNMHVNNTIVSKVCKSDSITYAYPYEVSTADRKVKLGYYTWQDIAAIQEV